MHHSLPRLRVAAAALFAGLLAACGDAPMQPGAASAAHLNFVPRFSEAAAAIFERLASFALAVDNVRVIVRSVVDGEELGPVLKDTTIAFPANQNELRIGIDVVLPSRTQDVVVLVQLREATTVFFEGTAELVAQVGATAGSPEPVAMSYVGPGAIASFLSLNRARVTIAPSSALQLLATAYDAGEHVVSGLPIVWSSSDATVLGVSETGLITSTGKIGTATITAKGLNGITAEAIIGVQPVARLVYLTGDKQSGIAGVLLGEPFSVQAQAADGTPVVGASITFDALTSGGSVTRSTATTDDNGAASTTIKLGAAIGVYTFRASVTGLPSVPALAVSATALASTPAAIAALSGMGQTQPVDAVLEPLVVQVRDALGNPVSGVAVTWQIAKGSALLYPDPIPDVGGVTKLVLATAADGTSRVRVVLGALAGAVEVSASVAPSSIAPVVFTATSLAGPAEQLLVVQQPSTAAQATIRLVQQPRVQLADRYGNPVRQSGVAVAASMTFFCDTRCDARTPPGAGAAGARVLQSSSASAAREARIGVPPAVTRTRSISDTIHFGLVGDTLRTTDANGVVAFTDLALNFYVGSFQLEFTDPKDQLAPALSDVIRLSPGPARSIVAASPFAAPLDTTFVLLPTDTITPYVRVQDAVGNGIADVTVTWDSKLGTQGRLDSTTTRTDANGYATPGRWVLPGFTQPAFVIHANTPGLALENAPLPLYAILNLIGDAGNAQSFARPRSNTSRPPTTVITILASRMVSGATRVRSRSTITKSASIPAARVPFSFSANSA